MYWISGANSVSGVLYIVALTLTPACLRAFCCSVLCLYIMRHWFCSLWFSFAYKCQVGAYLGLSELAYCVRFVEYVEQRLDRLVVHHDLPTPLDNQLVGTFPLLSLVITSL